MLLKSPKVVDPESMEVDFDVSEDVDMHAVENDLPAGSTGGLERPQMMRNDLPNVNERPLERLLHGVTPSMML